MIKFNELRITKDGRYLIIDASVKSQDYYNDVYIDSVSIDTQDTYKDGGPSSSIVYFKEIKEDDTKTLRLELSVRDFLPSLANNMFFVYVRAKGTPSSNTPCGMDNEYTLGVTFNTCSLYNVFMGFMGEIEKSCTIPKNFTNLLLQLKALELSINTEHYAKAVEYYNKFIRDIGKSDTSILAKHCNCYG